MCVCTMRSSSIRLPVGTLAGTSPAQWFTVAPGLQPVCCFSHRPMVSRPQGIRSALELYDPTMTMASAALYFSQLRQQLLYQDSLVAKDILSFPLNTALRHPGSLLCSSIGLCSSNSSPTLF